MRKLHLSVLLCSLHFSILSFSATTINPIIGDVSYFTIMGQAPTDKVDERTRIMCHLLYAELLLRTADVSHLNKEQKTNRAVLLDELHEYALKGEFPMNYDYSQERKPCFIDENGTVCAVGRLVEVTEGLSAAQEINEAFKYAEVFEMDKQLLAEWAEENGLSLTECAIIQPTYQWRNRKNKSIEARGLLSWRPPAELFWGAQVMYYAFKISHRTTNRLAGIGAEYQQLDQGDFSVQLKLQYGITKWKKVIPYVGMNPEFYFADGREGVNLVPELGLRTQFGFKHLHFTATPYYAYHARLANSEHYSNGRHELGITLGVGWMFDETDGGYDF